VFGFLKKIRHKEEDYDYDDIKSGVLGRDEFAPEPPEDVAQREPARYGPPAEFAPRQPGFGEPIAFGESAGEPFGGTRTNRDYDIMDRLNLIETNLMAIRSQTETINERLKNLEMKLTQRRY
jgi:hypothetical protein